MKKLFIFLIIFSVSFLSQGQNILIANNNPGAAAGTGPAANVYTGTNALENAISNAVNGDIIYVVPSSIGYGDNDILIDREITLFGVGLRPDKDLGTSSLIDVNCFNCNIEVEASNVRLSGLIVDGEIRLGGDDTNVTYTDILIENCRTERIIQQPGNNVQLNNILIRNNVIEGTGSIASHILFEPINSNVVVTNNVMTEANIGATLMVQATGVLFTYNVFADTGTEGPFSSITNCTFDHNIFYGVSVAINPLSATGNTWNYNLAFGSSNDADHVFLVDGTAGNTGTGNIESVAGSNDPMFVNFPLTQFWDDGYDLSLMVGSPAINVNGEDVGVTGGATPFDPEGNLLPLIQSITIPSVIPVGTDLQVNVKAKGN